MEFETVYSSGALADISKVKQISSREFVLDKLEEST